MTGTLSSSKILIGLTGSMASGKSTALNCFKKLGAAVLSADEIVGQLYQKKAVQKQVRAWFGSVQAAVIAERVFKDSTARKKLEAFLHPLVWQEMTSQIRRSKKRCWVLELPLLFEAGWEDRVDVTVLITGGTKSQIARLATRGVKKAEYLRRIKAQLPEAEKIRRADICVGNDTTVTQLERKITRLYKALKQIYHF